MTAAPAAIMADRRRTTQARRRPPACLAAAKVARFVSWWQERGLVLRNIKLSDSDGAEWPPEFHDWRLLMMLIRVDSSNIVRNE